MHFAISLVKKCRVINSRIYYFLKSIENDSNKYLPYMNTNFYSIYRSGFRVENI